MCVPGLRAALLGSALLPLLVLAACGCGSSSDDATVTRIVSGVPDPCELLPPKVLESIVDASVAEARLGDRKENVVRATCFYRYEDGGVGTLTVEDAAVWQRRYDAGRAGYEERGVLLPDDKPVDGIGDEALLDARHNQLNVRAGELVLWAEHGRPIGSGASAQSSAGAAESRDLQTEMLSEAITRLDQSAHD